MHDCHGVEQAVARGVLEHLHHVDVAVLVIVVELGMCHEVAELVGYLRYACVIVAVGICVEHDGDLGRITPVICPREICHLLVLSVMVVVGQHRTSSVLVIVEHRIVDTVTCCV